MWKYAAILLLCIGLPGVVLSQNFHVAAFTRQNGLPSNEVNHVIKDHLGFMWIATDNGLVRFDGLHFRSFDHLAPSQYSRFFLQGQAGIWLGHDAGLSLLNPKLDTAEAKVVLPASILPQGKELYYPGELFLDGQANLWISQANGRVCRLSGNRVKKYTLKKEWPSAAYFGGNPALWLGTPGGELFFYEEKLDSFIQKAKVEHINGIASGQNLLWLASKNKVYQVDLDESGRQVKRLTSIACPGEATAITLTRSGNLYIGIKHKGLFLLNRKSGNREKWIKIYANNDPHRVDEIPFYNIKRIVPIGENQLWICSSEGLGVLQKRFFESAGRLPNGNTTSIAVGEQGQVFVNFGDLYQVMPADFGYQSRPIPITTPGAFTALTASPPNLWAGTSAGQLLNFSPRGQLLRSADLSQRGEGIFYLLYDQQERLWFCQAPAEKPIVGIACRLPDGSIKEYQQKAGLENRLLVIKETARGRIYAGGIGSNTYLYRYLPEEDVFINLSLPFDFYVSPNFEVHDLTVDEQGIVWLASTDGLLRYELDRIQKVSLSSEYDDTEIRAVTHLPDSSIWLATDTDGILRYKDGEVTALKEESGLPSKVTSYRSLVTDKKGRLWVGTAEGVVFSLNEGPQPHRTLPPFVMSGRINEQPFNPGDSVLILQPGDNLNLQIVRPAFHAYRTFYQHRFEGEEWSSPQTEQQLQFTHIPAGHYLLQVRAKEEGNRLWSQPLVLKLEVKPIWYKRPYFLWPIIGLSLLTLVWLAYKLKVDSPRFIEKAEADETISVSAPLASEQSNNNTGLLSLGGIHRLMHKIPPGIKWDLALEALAIEVIQTPSLKGYELAIRRGNKIEVEIFLGLKRGVKTQVLPCETDTSLANHCLAEQKTCVFEEWPGNEALQEKSSSALAIPFKLERQAAVLILYSRPGYSFNEQAVKTLKTLTIYFEQITFEF